MARFNQYPAPQLPLTGQELLVLSQPQGARTVTVTATLDQIAAATSQETVGKILVSLATTNATPVAISGMPAVPASGGCCMLQGFIMCQNTATGDTAAWNIALLVKRLAGSYLCSTVGDTTPSVFAQEGTTSACNITLSAGQAGPVVTVTDRKSVV